MTNHRNVIQSKGVCIPKNKIFQKLTFLKKEYYLGQEANKEDIVDAEYRMQMEKMIEMQQEQMYTEI